MKNIVVIGGGTGLSSMMMGMKKLKNVNLTAIVTVAVSYTQLTLPTIGG